MRRRVRAFIGVSFYGCPRNLESAPVPDRLRDFRWQLSLVALAGFGIRVWSVLAWQRDFPVEGAQIYYHFGGRALAAGDGLLNPFLWDNGAGVITPSAQHPPLYTIYLGLWSFFGVDSATGHKLVSCLLGVGVVVVFMAFLLFRVQFVEHRARRKTKTP